MATSYQRPVDSREGFSRGAAAYGAGVGTFTAMTAERLVEQAGVQTGARLLDLGTGPGLVVGAARSKGANCIGLDNARGMLDEASSKLGPNCWVLGQGDKLPFGDSSADVVTAAYAFGCIAPGGTLSEEVLRVLRPGGTLAFANWVPAGCMNVRILAAAIEDVGDPEAPPPPEHPKWLFPKLLDYETLVAASALVQGKAEFVEHVWQLDSPYQLFDSLLRVNPRLQGHRREYLDRIRNATAERAEEHRNGMLIELPMLIAYGFAKRAPV